MVEEEIERPPFDINLAVILAGFAFEAYTSPPVNHSCHISHFIYLFIFELGFVWLLRKLGKRKGSSNFAVESTDTYIKKENLRTCNNGDHFTSLL